MIQSDAEFAVSPSERRSPQAPRQAPRQAHAGPSPGASARLRASSHFASAVSGDLRCQIPWEVTEKRSIQLSAFNTEQYGPRGI
ncbi:hypothetical protein GN956_G15186 [Arapaima gigas]